jgi:hypothetical protein
MRLLPRVLALSMVSTACFAQVTYEGCRDVRGIPVASMVNFGLNDVAMANLAPNGAPVIQYNPNVLAWLAPQTRLFFYAHECAHHARGHAFGSVHPLSQEQDADCTGIRFLVEGGYLSEDDVGVIQADLSRAGRGDWTHLPGPQRAINLRSCLGRSAGSATRSSDRRSSAASVCATSFGTCRLTNTVPSGSACFCSTGSGPIWGLAR